MAADAVANLQNLLTLIAISSIPKTHVSSARQDFISDKASALKSSKHAATLT
jgi:hypothetical protein